MSLRMRWIGYVIHCTAMTFCLIMHCYWKNYVCQSICQIPTGFDLKHGTFFPINPYHPTDPTDSELTLGFKIASTIADTFGLQTPVQRSPDYCHRLPIQKPSDFINCGVYVCLYMVIYSFGSMSKQYVGDLLPRSVGECRLLLLSWILRGEIYFLPPDNKQR